MNKELCFKTLLAVVHHSTKDSQTKQHVCAVQRALNDPDPLKAVHAAYTWIEARPYALQVELEVARAIMHTYRTTGLVQSTTLDQYTTRLAAMDKRYRAAIASVQQ